MTIRGSLDNPPIVISSSRWKTVWSVLLFLAVLGFIMEAPPGSLSKLLEILRYPVVALTALVCGALIIRLFVPARLEISPSGVVFYAGAKTYNWVWREISDFSAVREKRGRYTFEFIRVNLVPTAANSGSGPVVNPAPVPRDAIGAMGWPLDNDELAKLLNDARARWGNARTKQVTEQSHV